MNSTGCALSRLRASFLAGKWAVVAFCGAGLFLSACNKPAPTSEERKQPEPVPVAPVANPAPPVVPPESQAVVEVQPELKAEPEPVVEVPPQPVKVLAPEGTLFAMERLSVTSEDGIRGVNPGARLKIVRKVPGGYMVTDGKSEFQVEEHQVTNEMNTAAQVVQTHRTETAINAAAAQTQFQVQSEMERIRKQEADISDRSASKEKRIRDLETLLTALIREEAALSAKLEQASNEDYRYGRIHTRTIDQGVRTGWRARHKVLQEEKWRVQNELGRLRY